MKFTFKASWISISLLVKKSEIRIPFLRKIFKAFCCFWIIFFDKRIDIWRLYDWKVLFEVCIRAFWDCTRLRFVLLSVYFILVIVLTLILSWNLINWIKKLALRLDNLGWEHPWTRFWLKRSDWGYSQIGLLQNNGLLLVAEHGRHNMTYNISIQNFVLIWVNDWLELKNHLLIVGKINLNNYKTINKSEGNEIFGAIFI